MWGIIEKNGDYIIGLILEPESGSVKLFNTKPEAEIFAKKNCAFEYSVVEI